MKISSRRPIWILCWILVLAAHPACAASLMVAPTTLVLKDSSEIGVLYITNGGDKDTVAQIEGLDWSQGSDGDVLTPSNVLVISPPMARIPAGQTQTIRLQATGGVDLKERSFRILVSELPDASDSSEGVKLLLQFSVPVFIAGADKNKHQVSFEAREAKKELIVSATNVGPSHVKLTGLSVAHKGPKPAAKADKLVYILPGARHVWRFPKSSIVAGDYVRIEANGNAPKVAAELTVQR